MIKTLNEIFSVSVLSLCAVFFQNYCFLLSNVGQKSTWKKLIETVIIPVNSTKYNKIFSSQRI